MNLENQTFKKIRKMFWTHFQTNINFKTEKFQVENVL